MKKFAEAVNMAIDIYEGSYDHEGADKILESGEGTDFEKFYQKTLFESAVEAAEKVGYGKEGATPIYLLLKYTWNDILEWTMEEQRD